MFDLLEFHIRITHLEDFAALTRGMHCCMFSVRRDFGVSSSMFSSDLKGCLFSLIPFPHQPPLPLSSP